MIKDLMKNKKGLIMGVANDHSIAWGIAKTLHEAGAELAFTYQGENLEKRVKPLAQSINSDFTVPCDVKNEESIKQCFSALKEKWGKIDFLVHAIAFSDRNELKGRYVDTTRENFLNTMEISCFSFTNVCKYASELMTEGGSCITLTYLGSQKCLPNYNVMGVAKAALEASVNYLAYDLGSKNIRVNAISAGPIRTLAASGIGDFRFMLDWNKNNSALNENITSSDVGNTALYLLSDLSTHVTAETIYVDSGYNKVTMMNLRHVAENATLLSEIAKQC